jgi:hypothetical protein
MTKTIILEKKMALLPDVFTRDIIALIWNFNKLKKSSPGNKNLIFQTTTPTKD